MNDTDYLMQKMTRAFEMREGRGFTSLEKQFLRAAAHGSTGRGHACCDVPRMKALLEERPTLLESVGSVALSMAVTYIGTHDALLFLLERGIREFYDCQTGLYRKHQHEPVTAAFYHGNFKNLRTVFEAGVSDASVISTSHVGWPANTSLLFWAVGRPVEYTEFALAYGADPEAPFSGNGERGNTPLQEAASRFGTGGWNPDIADTVLALLGHGAHAPPQGRVRGPARSGRGAHRPGSRQEAGDEVRQEAAAGGAAGLPTPEGGVRPADICAGRVDWISQPMAGEATADCSRNRGR